MPTPDRQTNNEPKVKTGSERSTNNSTEQKTASTEWIRDLITFFGLNTAHEKNKSSHYKPSNSINNK